MGNQKKIGTEKEMSFLEHLEELRWRLVKASVAILFFAIGAFIAKKVIFDVILFGPKSSDFVTYRWFCWLSQQLGLGDNLCMGDVAISIQNIDLIIGNQISMNFIKSTVDDGWFLNDRPYFLNSYRHHIHQRNHHDH